ncbi:MAG: hybrid sensor histidine kinase/response regulator [Candidatus Rokuibacteriota bacterium]
MANTADAKILIVDDEPANVRLLERLLVAASYTRLRSTTDARQALPLYRDFEPDLVLLDLLMPHLDGVAVLGQLASAIPAGAYVPVLVLTADATPEARRRALAAGARDFLTKPFDTVEVLLRVKNLLETRALHQDLQQQNAALEDRVRERTRQLVQAEKLAAMGSLLAGVSHELNNPLAVVMGHAALLVTAARGTPQAERATKINAAAERCVRIVRNFLALARRQRPQRVDTRLDAVVQEAVELLAYQLRLDEIVVTFEFAPDLPAVWADRHQLHQVLVNLITNAHYAMRHTPPPRRLTLSTAWDRDDERVRLTVRDTGPGIPAEAQSQIFEAFFTTKPEGEGTGLGLALCQGIISEHGGTIRLESSPGEGATFSIHLPVGTPRPSLALDATPADTATPASGSAILVIDDEPEVASVLVDLLELDGYRAESVNNGADALERLAQKTYDLVISDSRMPILDGPGLYRELQRTRPELLGRLIFVTGDTLSVEKRRFLESTGLPSLSKPFVLAEVRDAVRRVLARGA